ncbi:MAG: response regulator transcription factor [Deltaproteobacteria bacterium]|nr:response regulator transcription factor [Deltaproteobacteria bacterium]
MPTIRTVVADDHGLVRAGLVALLRDERDLEVVAQASDGEDALRHIERLRPEVAVVDVAMPGMTGIEVARKARDLGARTAVVLLSVSGGPEFVRAAVDAGAAGYVVKAAAARELVDAVRSAAAGHFFLSPSVARDALGGGGPQVAPPPTALSPRERDVLRLIARGLSSKEVADALGLRTRTVETYRVSIMDKVGIRHIAGLTKYAIRHHLATLDE